MNRKMVGFAAALVMYAALTGCSSHRRVSPSDVFFDATETQTGYTENIIRAARDKPEEFRTSNIYGDKEGLLSKAGAYGRNTFSLTNGEIEPNEHWNQIPDYSDGVKLEDYKGIPQNCRDSLEVLINQGHKPEKLIGFLPHQYNMALDTIIGLSNANGIYGCGVIALDMPGFNLKNGSEEAKYRAAFDFIARNPAYVEEIATDVRACVSRGNRADVRAGAITKDWNFVTIVASTVIPNILNHGSSGSSGIFGKSVGGGKGASNIGNVIY